MNTIEMRPFSPRGHIHLYASYLFNFIVIVRWICLDVFSSENIALLKYAWQLHPYGNPDLKDAVGASKAVDGLKNNLSFAGQQCTVSDEKKYEALWHVDLGANLGIHHITIYYRTANVTWGKIIDYVRFVI